MTLLTGINHVAVLTADLDRFVAFYEEVFEADVVFREDTPDLTHAMLRVGDGVLHAVARPGSEHALGAAAMLDRGHLDHIGLTVADESAFDEVRARLCRHGATDGTVFDLGPQLSIWFTDPDGMAGEVCWNRDPSLTGFHAPAPVHRPTP